MGFWKFCAHRVADLFIPGAGLLLDVMDAIELVEHMVETGEITASDALDLKDHIESAKENGEAIKAEVITRRVRRCGICRQPGHNRRTCPQK